MSFPIAPINTPALIGSIDKVVSTPADNTFGQAFSSAVQNVENSNATANAAAQNFLSGGTQELHSTILATQSAELDMEMFLQVRNKVVSAYEEIMKMQL